MIRLLTITAVISVCRALYPSSSSVIVLTPTNFDRLVIKTDEVWIVEFFAPWCGHCQALVPQFIKTATALKGIIKVGAVDADKYKELAGRYGVRAFPTIKLFGGNNRPDDYNGPRTAQGLADAALKVATAKVKASLGGSTKSDVIELTDSNFDELVLQSEDMWLVEFFAPWCGHCRNLATHWAKAATELKGKIKLGALDATVHKVKASKYGVEGYPTIKFFAPGRKSSSSVSDYDGGRTSDEIVAWVSEKLDVPVPEVAQIISQDVFMEACDQKPLCVVAILPHILDCQSECRNNYVGILKDLGGKYKKKMWGWIWSEAGGQPELERALEIGGFGYPAMAVINARKMKYSILRGGFSTDGIDEFLRDLSYGRGNTFPVKGQELPKIVEVEPWDGQDGEFPQEEEIDLSDVQLEGKDEL